MKNLFFISILSVIIVACGGNQPEGDQTLSGLKARKDSLKAVHEEVGKQIAALDGQIALLDTSKKLTLVSTVKVSRKKFEHYFEVQGNVEAEKNTMIYPEAGGTIREIRVKEGQVVNKGDLLIRLDQDVLQKSIQEAKTSANLANTIYEKQTRLWEQKIGSEIQYLEAKANKEAAQARLESMNAQLELLSVRAPYSGIIDEIFPKMGELATPQMPLARIVNLEKVYIKSDVSERYIGKVKQGTDVHILLPSSKEELQSSVSLIGNYINPHNRTFKIQIKLDNKSNILKPNLLATIRIKDFEKDSVVVLPEAMIQQTPAGEDFVYLLTKKDGHHYVNKKVIKTGMSYKNMVMIKKGLNGNEEIVEKGARSVKDGQRVVVAS
jgi:membrane fusion protein (multidrug efflux system)